jgi:serine-type D-Ala-D-Ala carboxypeptidase/endopeptidase (penicillin-binding protein 4)
VLPRSVVAGLVASLVALTGCATAVSGASETTTTTAPVALPVAPTTTTVPGPSALALALDATWAQTPPGSCLVVSDGRRVVYERGPDQPVIPASTMKLLTGVAALTQLDPQSRLRTPVLATAGPGPDGVVHGDLWLVGGGDPTLGTIPYAAHFRRQPRLINPMEVLADRLVAAGVRHVTGRIVGDDGRHDRQRYVDTWPSRFVAGNQTGPLSALTVNDAFAAWGATTAPFADPAQGGAGVLDALLRERGVAIGGPPASGSVAPGAIELAALDSPTIEELVASMLLDSDNTTAELLLRELGLQVHGQATTDAGRRVVHDTLARLGLPLTGVHVADGSGLDPTNRVTCRLLVEVLTAVPGIQDALLRALPVAAQTGTLYQRFLDTPVAGRLRAKTGSIRGVASLAGQVDGADGRTLTFAYVLNAVGPLQGQQLQDRLGHDLVLHSP